MTSSLFTPLVRYPRTLMLKKLLKKRLLVPVLALLLLPGCLAGPNQLGRSWDDWVGDRYTENAWLHGAVFQNVLPVYPIAGGLLGFLDMIILNPYYFWSQDAWDNRGTAYKHNPTPASPRTVDSSF